MTMYGQSCYRQDYWGDWDLKKEGKDNEYEIIYREDNITTHIIIARSADCFEVCGCMHIMAMSFHDSSCKCRISYLHEFQKCVL